MSTSSEPSRESSARALPPTRDAEARTPFSLQDVLSLGYLYLLLVGIVSDSIYYGFFGVAILSYSDALDVLLSPIAYMEREPRFFLVIVGVTAFLAAVFAVQSLRLARLSTSAEFLAAHGGASKAAETARRLRLLQVVIPGIAVFAGYVGYAAGSAKNQASQMASGTLPPDHRIVLTGGEPLLARVLGSTGNFIFYVREGGTRVTISPFKENVQSIEAL